MLSSIIVLPSQGPTAFPIMGVFLSHGYEVEANAKEIDICSSYRKGENAILVTNTAKSMWRFGSR